MPAAKTVKNTKKVNTKATKTEKVATKKAAPKKPATKKVAKVAVAEKPKKEMKNRRFSIIYNGVRIAATPSGKRPKQAANKALTSIFNSMDEATRASMIGKDINFVLYENGRRKKKVVKGGNGKVVVPRRIFRYTGKRVETGKKDTIQGGSPVQIKHEVIKRCDECEKRINALKDIEKDAPITKKQVDKNLKLINRVNEYTKKVEELKKDKTADKSKLDRLVKNLDECKKKIEANEHITKHRQEYDVIVNCKKCTKEVKTITYKYTNTVKKTDDKNLTEEDKKITSEFIDAIEEKLKEERKAAEDKKVAEKPKAEKPKTEAKQPVKSIKKSAAKK